MFDLQQPRHIPTLPFAYRSGLIETSASASSGHRRIGKAMALAGQLFSKAETSRTNRELKLRGRLRPPFHRRGHAIGVLR
jgi:hypothetical protein